MSSHVIVYVLIFMYFLSLYQYFNSIHSVVLLVHNSIIDSWEYWKISLDYRSKLNY